MLSSSSAQPRTLHSSVYPSRYPILPLTSLKICYCFALTSNLSNFIGYNHCHGLTRGSKSSNCNSAANSSLH
ncbi:hypothetical protein AAHA92_15426 [Salvia divinorum]|uniref:Uncharacterized protein n=1 Tax=Salvia divinorum TaxID=28513 RepID=A0ABD1HF92_SALDI